MNGPLLLFPILLGLAGLWAGAALVLHAASRMAARSGRPEMVFGLAFAALGPMLPELGIAAAMSARAASFTPDASMLVMGTVLGSALARTTLVLGSATLLGVTGGEPEKHGGRPPLLLICIGLVAGLSWDGVLGTLDGGILAGVGVVALVRRVRAWARRMRGATAAYGVLPDPFLVITGLAVVAGAGLVVAPRSVAMAGAWGIDPTLVGLLVLGLGASVPELALAVNAATGGRRELSMSSVLTHGPLGLLVPLAVAALIAPVQVHRWAVLLDLPALALVVTALWLLDRRGVPLTRGWAVGLVAFFLLFAFARMGTTWF